MRGVASFSVQGVYDHSELCGRRTSVGRWYDRPLRERCEPRRAIARVAEGGSVGHAACVLGETVSKTSGEHRRLQRRVGRQCARELEEHAAEREDVGAGRAGVEVAGRDEHEAARPGRGPETAREAEVTEARAQVGVEQDVGALWIMF